MERGMVIKKQLKQKLLKKLLMRLSKRACLQLNIERFHITPLMAEYGRITFNI